MKQHEEVKVEFTIQWIEKADADLRAAQFLFKAGDRYLQTIAFLAQQTAEKYLKAFLVWHQIEFKKTHDIAAILRLASQVDPDLADVLEDAELLTPYGVEYRYPGDYPPVTTELTGEILDIAARVRDEIRKRLPLIVLPKESD